MTARPSRRWLAPFGTTPITTRERLEGPIAAIQMPTCRLIVTPPGPGGAAVAARECAVVGIS